MTDREIYWWLFALVAVPVVGTLLMAVAIRAQWIQPY